MAGGRAGTVGGGGGGGRWGGGGRLKHEGEYAWLMSQRILSDGGSGKVIIQGAIVSRLASGLTYLTYWGRGGGHSHD